MSVIGTFTPTKDGGWVGTIRTLTIDVKARFVPNDNRDNDSAPAFRIFAASSEIGAAWKKQSGGDEPRDYLSVRLEDPCLQEAVSAAMFEVAGGKGAQLVWHRRKSNLA